MISELWTTTVWNGRLSKFEVVPNIRWSAISHNGFGTRSSVHDEIEDRLCDVLRQKVGCGGSGLVSSTFEILKKADFRGPRCTGGKWAHVWAGALTDNTTTSCDGHVALHDPRAGAALVTMPGMPWAKGQSFLLVDGLSLLIPGWLSWSVPIVRGQQEYILACVTLS